MDRKLLTLAACAALIGCGDPTALNDDTPTQVDTVLDLLGLELPAGQGNEAPELPSDNMWDYEVPHDLYDPCPRGGQPLELESIPEDPTVWLVWQSTDELSRRGAAG